MPVNRSRRRVILAAMRQHPHRSVPLWNNLNDRTRMAGNPVRLRRNLERMLPPRYVVREDLTIRRPRQRQGTTPDRNPPRFI